MFNLQEVFPESSHSIENESVILDQIVKDALEMNKISPAGYTFMIPPGAKYLLRTRFNPSVKDMMSNVILLRNNLTGMETILIKGRAGMGQLSVGNGVPGSSLLFQLTEKLLQGCQSERISFN